MTLEMSRRQHADMYGPTTGDKIRLADTELWLEVEADLTGRGDEAKFGGGKVIRDGMGQDPQALAEAMDLVITNAVILDYWGIVKADIGIKDGRIFGLGHAGNPKTMAGVNLPVGAGTEVIAAENYIVTAGGIDTIFILFVRSRLRPRLPQELPHAGGRHRAGAGTNATTCTPVNGIYPGCCRLRKVFPLIWVFLAKEITLVRNR